MEICKAPTLRLKTYQLSQIKDFLNLHARKLFFFYAYIYLFIFYPSSITNHRLVYLRDRSRQFSITQSISDYNFLSSLPLKERLNKEVLMHTIMSGKVPLFLAAKCSLNQSRPIPMSDVFKSSIVFWKCSLELTPRCS